MDDLADMTRMPSLPLDPTLLVRSIDPMHSTLSSCV